MKRLRVKLLGLVMLVAIIIVSAVCIAAPVETITYWTWVPTDIQWKQLEPVFSKQFPNVKVEFWRAEGDQYFSKLQVAMAAGEGPDVMGMSVGARINQYAKFLMPIKPMADAKWGKGWETKFSPVSFAETKSGNSLVALPINFTAQTFLFYNKSILDACGIKDIPVKYGDFKKVCSIIKAKGYIPVVLGAKDIWVDCDMFVYLSNQFAPGKIYQAEAGKVKFTDKAFVETMKAWKMLVDDKIFEDGALGVTSYPDARDQYFYAGKAAMFVIGTWHAGSAIPGQEKWGTKIENDPTGFALFPQMGPYPARAIASVDTAIAINKNTKHKEAAWKLFSFMTMGEGQQIMADTMQGSPSKKGIQIRTLDQFKHQSEKDGVKIINSQIENAVGKRLLNNQELINAIGVACQDVAAGKPIEQALKEIQQVSDKIKR